MNLAFIEEIEELFRYRWYPYILLCLVDGPQSFSDLARIINDQAPDRLADSVLYRNLDLLEADGLVAGQPQGDGRRRSPWRLTENATPVVTKLLLLKRALAGELVEAPSTLTATATTLRTDTDTPRAPNDSATADSSPALPDWAPPEVDPTRPSVARSYDYLLGGSHNFEVDREQGRQAIALMPDVVWGVRANRTFLGRAVRYMLSEGVRQFLDIGSGIPTVGNVHEIIQRAGVDARVVYVDLDPVAVAHSRHILTSNDRAAVIQEDLRRPEAMFAHEDLQNMLDLDQPIGLMLVAILHALADNDDPYGIVQRLRDRIAPGSYIAIGHATTDHQAEIMNKIADLSHRTTTPFTWRTHKDILRFFDGLDLLEPGVVWAPLWRPEPTQDLPAHPERCSNYVGVGRKPGPAIRPLRRASDAASAPPPGRVASSDDHS